MPETTTPPPVVARPSKPVSEALLNEKVFPFFFPLVCTGLSSLLPPANNYFNPSQKEVWLTLTKQWDKCLSSFLIRSSLGLSFGVVFSVLLFKRRAWPAFVGLGFGAGRAYEECNGGFLRGAGKEGVRVQRP